MTNRSSIITLPTCFWRIGAAGWRIIMAGLLCSCGARGVLAQEQVGPWKIERHTNAIEVTAVDETPYRQTITLKNASSRVITGYVLSAWSQQVHTLETLGQPWAPGETKIWTVGPELARSTDYTIRVLGVVFEDGTSEGGSPKIQELHFQRLGMMLEYARIDELLSAQRGAPADKEPLLRAIGPLPETPEEAVASLSNVTFRGLSARRINPPRPDHTESRRLMGSFLGGVRVARETAQLRLKDLDNQSSDFSSTVTDPALRRAARFDRMVAEVKANVAMFSGYVSRTGGVAR
jgi:hypothetical protein